MGWNISVFDNTLSLTKKQFKGLANALINSGYGCEDDPEEVARQLSIDAPLISFDNDAMEHKDYIPFVKDYLIAQKVTGKVTFGSTEGDNKGQYWSYEFKNGELKEDSGLLKNLLKRSSSKNTSSTASSHSNSTFLTGKNIVITGKLANGTRSEWEARLAAHGANIRSKVGKDTNLLITNEADSGSEKAMTAKKFGTPVMNEEAVENLIKLFS